MTRYLLIRHALTDAVGNRLSGRMPGIHLNETGIDQTNQIVKRLSRVPIAGIYSSPLERAIETAAPIAKRCNLENIICNDFIEIDFGLWTGCTIDEVRAQPSFQQFNTFRSTTRIPGGELMAEAQLRMIKGIEKLQRQYDHQTVAIISHGDLIKAAVAYYAGIHLDMFHRIEISPASISMIEVYEDSARIMVVNDTDGISF